MISHRLKSCLLIVDDAMPVKQEIESIIEDAVEEELTAAKVRIRLMQLERRPVKLSGAARDAWSMRSWELRGTVPENRMAPTPLNLMLLAELIEPRVAANAKTWPDALRKAASEALTTRILENK